MTYASQFLHVIHPAPASLTGRKPPMLLSAQTNTQAALCFSHWWIDHLTYDRKAKEQREAIDPDPQCLVIRAPRIPISRTQMTRRKYRLCRHRIIFSHQSDLPVMLHTPKSGVPQFLSNSVNGHPRRVQHQNRHGGISHCLPRSAFRSSLEAKECKIQNLSRESQRFQIPR